MGLERTRHLRPAGLRTHMLVCIGACLFTIVGIYAFSADTRIAAGIVSGIGFLGAGAILRRDSEVRGLTTAGSIWAVAAVGMASGAGLYLTAAFVAVAVLLILALLRGVKGSIEEGAAGAHAHRRADDPVD